MRKFLLFLASPLLWGACSQEEALWPEQEPAPESYRISLIEAKRNALAFVQQAQPATRSVQLPNFGSSFAVTSDVLPTRGSSSDKVKDTLYYVINFADNQGYVIASADKREAAIFAYVPKGNLSKDYRPEDPSNGFDLFMANLESKEYAKQIITEEDMAQGYYITDDGSIVASGGRGLRDTLERMEPQLQTNWGQLSPYNLYNPRREETPYTGCVITAASQICAYLRFPNYVSYNYSGDIGITVLDWPTIIKESINQETKGFGQLTNESSASSKQVAHLMRFWGGIFNADYEPDGTGAKSEDAISKMQQLGIKISNTVEYNPNTIIDELKKGNRIVYMAGNADYSTILFIFKRYTKGHAWLIDGYIRSFKSGRTSLYLHCNWGWNGNNNGYFLSNMFAPSNPDARFKDKDSRSSHYQYNLRQAIVER